MKRACLINTKRGLRVFLRRALRGSSDLIKLKYLRMKTFLTLKRQNSTDSDFMCILKKENIIILLLFLFSVFTIISCEKEVYIDLPEPEVRLVVEGWIEQDKYPVVAITRNSPYFSKVDSTTLMNLFILDAQVYVSDGEQTEKLELDYSNLLKGIWPFICYKGSSLKGEIGKTYNLTIYAEGDTITGVTTLPHQVNFDSLWWKPDNETKPNNDTLGYIWATFTDNPALDEYFKIFTMRRNRDKDFVPLFGSVHCDLFFQGKTFTFSMYRGIPALSDSEAIKEDKELFYFKRGDTVDVKLTSIDKAHYEFWRTIEQELYTGGNPFVYPVVIRHNVKGALGVWGGYTATYYTIIIGE